MAHESSIVGTTTAPVTTARIVISSRLRNDQHENKDMGPWWEIDVPARADGSPCLNALADAGLFADACARNESGADIASVTAAWGTHYLLHDTGPRGDLSIYPPRASAVRRVLRFLDQDAA